MRRRWAHTNLLLCCLPPSRSSQIEIWRYFIYKQTEQKCVAQEQKIEWRKKSTKSHRWGRRSGIFFIRLRKAIRRVCRGYTVVGLIKRPKEYDSFKIVLSSLDVIYEQSYRVSSRVKRQWWVGGGSISWFALGFWQGFIRKGWHWI